MRKAIDWEKGLSNALAKSLENTGYCSSGGAKVKFPNNDGHFSGTTPDTVVTAEPTVVTTEPLPVTTENQSNFRQVVGSGCQESQHLQPFSTTVTTGTAVTTEIKDETVERAAIVEFDAGIRRAWAEGFARLDRQQPLAGYSETQWHHIIDDGGNFLDAWGVKAAALGWAAADVFGLCPPTPINPDDAMGLVFLIGGGVVTAISERSALIQRNGSSFIYSRRYHTSICVWEAPSAEAKT